MKQLKFLMVALTLLMGVSLTSCLDSGDNGSTYDEGLYLRTQNYMGSCFFVDLEGNRYYPTPASLAAMTNSGFKAENADLVIVYFKWADELSSSSSSTDRTIELVQITPIDSYRAVPLSSEAELENFENAPIVTLNPMTNGSFGSNTINPMLYGSQMVVLPVAWKMEYKAETLKQHTFTLAYVEEAQQDNSELVLYLCHDKGTDEKTDFTNVAFKAFDIQSFMDMIKNQTGSYPSKVTIKAKANTDGTTMPDDYTSYEIDSSFLNNK